MKFTQGGSGYVMMKRIPLLVLLFYIITTVSNGQEGDGPQEDDAPQEGQEGDAPQEGQEGDGQE